MLDRDGEGMTLNTCMSLADMLAPNGIDASVKRRWVSELDGMVRVELLGESPASLAPDTMDAAPLTVPFPFDRMYWIYLIAMIEAVHGDNIRYTNAAAMFHSVYDRYAKWLARGGAS